MKSIINKQKLKKPKIVSKTKKKRAEKQSDSQASVANLIWAQPSESIAFYPQECSSENENSFNPFRLGRNKINYPYEEDNHFLEERNFGRNAEPI